MEKADKKTKKQKTHTHREAGESKYEGLNLEVRLLSVKTKFVAFWLCILGEFGFGQIASLCLVSPSIK